MDIVYFSDSPRLGGAERYLADIVAAAGDAGHRTTVVSPQSGVLELMPSTATRVRLGAAAAAYADAPGPAARAVRLARTAGELRAALARPRAAVLHVNNGGYPGSDLARVAVLLGGLAGLRRRLLSVHSLPWPREHSQPQVQAVVDRLMWRSLHGVLGATHVVGRLLTDSRGMPADLYRRIPYGVAAPDDRDAAGVRARLAPDGAPLVALVSASADAEKGHAVLAEALARCRVSWRAVIVGADPGVGFREQLTRLGVADRVVIAGRVPAVGPFLHAADALVVPSTAFESLPLVALEAMAAGRPVLASHISGLPEVVEDGANGRLLAPGDPQALAAALDAGGRDRDTLARMGAEGRRRWSAHFSVPAMAAATLRCYEE